MNKIKKHHGLAAVELTLLVPFILLLLYIAIDFGRVMSELIITNSSAHSSTGYGSIHNSGLSNPLDHNGMEAIAIKDASALAVNSGESDAITVTTQRVCRCYDSDLLSGGGTLPEPTTSACSATCNDNKEVYIQTTVTRNFKTFSGHVSMPDSMALHRTARFRVE